MAATGAFNTLLNRTIQRQNVIYRAPNTAPTGGSVTPSASPPPNRMPVSSAPTVPTGGGLTVPGTVYPVNVDPGGTGGAQPVSSFGSSGTGTATGGQGTSPATGGGSSEPGTSGAGPAVGGGNQTDTGHLLDLLASAFQPQDISQPYGPTAVDSVNNPSGGGTNPMAVVVLAILAIIGVVYYVHRKGKRA